MPRTHEDQENEKMVRMQAEQTQNWQRVITADEDLEKWVSDGHWDFLKRRLFDDIEKEIFNTIKNPAFDPANVAQVTQFKAMCLLKDLIEARIQSRLSAVSDARTQLQQLENSTLKEAGE